MVKRRISGKQTPSGDHALPQPRRRLRGGTTTLDAGGAHAFSEASLGHILNLLIDLDILRLAQTGLATRRDVAAHCGSAFGPVAFSSAGVSGLWRHVSLTHLAQSLRDMSAIRFAKEHEASGSQEVRGFIEIAREVVASASGRTAVFDKFCFSPPEVRRTMDKVDDGNGAWCSAGSTVLSHDGHDLYCQLCACHNEDDDPPHLRLDLDDTDDIGEYLEVWGISPTFSSVRMKTTEVRHGTDSEPHLVTEESAEGQTMLRGHPIPLVLYLARAGVQEVDRMPTRHIWSGIRL